MNAAEYKKIAMKNAVFLAENPCCFMTDEEVRVKYEMLKTEIERMKNSPPVYLKPPQSTPF